MRAGEERPFPVSGVACVKVVAVIVFLFWVAGRPASAEPVGRFTIVQGDVVGSRPAEPANIPVRVGTKIDLDVRWAIGESSAAQVLFGEDAIVSTGASTTFALSRRRVDESEETPVPVLELSRGMIRAFVSRPSTAEPEMVVEAGPIVVRIRGAEAVVEVLDDGTARVTRLGGDGYVRWRAASPAWSDLTRRRRVALGPGSDRSPEVVEISSEVEASLYRSTLPRPTPSRRRPRARDNELYGPSGVAASRGGQGN